MREEKSLDGLLNRINECKELASEIGLDPDQLNGLLGEATALKVIRGKIDKDYQPAPPRENYIDGVGALGTYSVKFLTPRMDIPKSSKRNLIFLNAELDFDFLTIICNTGEVFNVPKSKIVNKRQFDIYERRSNKMINWMTTGTKRKKAIRPTNDNWKTLTENYLVCTLS